jgi:hypothetical protein
MARARIARDLLAILMESPLYFTIPLKRRLEFIRCDYVLSSEEVMVVELRQA